jgi:hypothetical protein
VEPQPAGSETLSLEIGQGALLVAQVARDGEQQSRQREQ